MPKILGGCYQVSSMIITLMFAVTILFCVKNELFTYAMYNQFKTGPLLQILDELWSYSGDAVMYAMLNSMSVTLWYAYVMLCFVVLISCMLCKLYRVL